MIYGIFIGEGEPGYTLMKKVFNSMENDQLKFNWLIANYECFPVTEEYEKIFGWHTCSPVFMSGERITEIVNTEDFLWVWGTFLSFAKDISEEEIMSHKLPWCDEYNGYWKIPYSMQHPLAETEIIAFDSTFTIVLTKNKELYDKIRKAYPLSVDLEDEIKSDKKYH
ncbi:MAG: hypothetical protein E7600_01545 [Ruminococcaceae bacterium]|nr:hypothetical protein [Oscillospiraceae bacterium]